MKYFYAGLILVLGFPFSSVCAGPPTKGEILHYRQLRATRSSMISGCLGLLPKGQVETEQCFEQHGGKLLVSAVVNGKALTLPDAVKFIRRDDEAEILLRVRRKNKGPAASVWNAYYECIEDNPLERAGATTWTMVKDDIAAFLKLSQTCIGQVQANKKVTLTEANLFFDVPVVQPPDIEPDAMSTSPSGPTPAPEDNPHMAEDSGSND